MFNYKGVDLSIATIDGNYVLGAAVPNKVFGQIPNPVPAINGGLPFTPATYGLPNVNAGTNLEVVLQGATYMSAATKLYQISFIDMNITLNNYIPNDAQITAETNKHMDGIQSIAVKLFDKYSKQIATQDTTKDLASIKKVLIDKLTVNPSTDI